jgi:hypothetical protein
MVDTLQLLELYMCQNTNSVQIGVHLSGRSILQASLQNAQEGSSHARFGDH